MIFSSTPNGLDIISNKTSPPIFKLVLFENDTPLESTVFKAKPNSLRYRIISSRVKWMTFQYSLYSQNCPFYTPIFLYCFKGIIRTSRYKSALPRAYGGYNQLVCSYEKYNNIFHFSTSSLKSLALFIAFIISLSIS